MDCSHVGAPYMLGGAKSKGQARAAAELPRLCIAAESADGIPGASYLATADDFSFVKLFNGPVLADDAPYRCYRGHASHVTCVRFTSDDRRVISVGGLDRCVFQWRTVGVALPDQEHDAWILKAVEEAAFEKHEVRRSYRVDRA